MSNFTYDPFSRDRGSGKRSRASSPCTEYFRRLPRSRPPIIPNYLECLRQLSDRRSKYYTRNMCVRTCVRHRDVSLFIFPYPIKRKRFGRYTRLAGANQFVRFCVRLRGASANKGCVAVTYAPHYDSIRTDEREREKCGNVRYSRNIVSFS